MQLFTDLFKNVKYTAKEAKEDKDKNYTVEVEIEPAQIFDGVLEATQAEVESLVKWQNSFSDEDYLKLDAAMYDKDALGM